jgi:ribonuclease P/MRP protein subunit RPP40
VFDKVPHRRLAEKMSFYGIRNNTLSWVSNFLNDRLQQFVIDGESSNLSKVTSGVPQGTVLGPTLFLLFINDIATNISSSIRLFADDCVVYTPIRSKDDHCLLQNDLNTLVNWSTTWQMQFNIDKCAIMNITTKRNISKFDYKMQGTSLEIVKNHPYLGVELNEKLKFNLHIDNITSKASSALGFLKRNLRHCPKQVKERAYHTLVRPKLEYSSTIWNPQQKTQVSQIEQIQRNAARFVLGKPFNYQNPSSVTSMIQELNWPSLEKRRYNADLVLMYKVVHKLVAVPTSILPVPSARHEMKFIPYHCKINAYQHSFFPRVIVPWNRLPDQVLQLDTVDSFKAALQPAVVV